MRAHEYKNKPPMDKSFSSCTIILFNSEGDKMINLYKKHQNGLFLMRIIKITWIY